MTKQTLDLIFRVAIEVIEWIGHILKEKRSEKDDYQGASEKKR